MKKSNKLVTCVHVLEAFMYAAAIYYQSGILSTIFLDLLILYRQCYLIGNDLTSSTLTSVHTLLFKIRTIDKGNNTDVWWHIWMTLTYITHINMTILPLLEGIHLCSIGMENKILVLFLVLYFGAGEGTTFCSNINLYTSKT